MIYSVLLAEKFSLKVSESFGILVYLKTMKNVIFLFQIKVDVVESQFLNLILKRNKIIKEQVDNILPNMIDKKRDCDFCPVNKICSLINISYNLQEP